MILLTMVSATMHTLLGLFNYFVYLLTVIVIPNYPCKAKVARDSGLVLGANLKLTHDNCLRIVLLQSSRILKNKKYKGHNCLIF